MGLDMPDPAWEEEETLDALPSGATLMRGQYRVERFLSAGGFGLTYIAIDSLDRRVVVKECFPAASCHRSGLTVQARGREQTSALRAIVRAFVQEARNLARLDHPNVVGVHQVFEENGTAYMALDLVEGRDLAEILASEPAFSPEEIERLLRALLDAVSCVHDSGILHRDIAPDNVVLGAGMVPILIDFGAARVETARQARPVSALLAVKDGYSPQEFYAPGTTHGPSSDLYALAATFHHLISGEMPPSSQTRLAVIAGGQPDPFRPLQGRMEGFEPAILETLDAAMALAPADRIADARGWLERIDRGAAATRSARPRVLPALVTVATLGMALFGADRAGLIERVVPPRAPLAQPAKTAEAAGVSETALAMTGVARSEILPATGLPAARPAPASMTDVPTLAGSAWDLGDGVVNRGGSIDGVSDLGGAFAIDGMLTDWTAELPAGTRYGPAAGAIARVGEDAVADRGAFDRALRNAVTPSLQGEVALTASIAGEDGTLREVEMILPVKQRTELANGLAFETGREDDVWVTRVVRVPTAMRDRLEVGDVVFGYLPTSERLVDRLALPRIVATAAASGATGLALAIERGGRVYAVSVPATRRRMN